MRDLIAFLSIGTIVVMLAGVGYIIYDAVDYEPDPHQHSAIVKVLTTVGEHRYYGTGVALSQTQILTAKHVLHKEAATNIVVITDHGCTNQVVDVLYYEHTDAAVLIFDRPLRIEVPEYSLVVPEVGSFVSSTGYGGWLYLYKGGLVGGVYHDGLLEAGLSAQAGDSGSPVFYEGKVIGIILRVIHHTPITGILPTRAFKELL